MLVSMELFSYEIELNDSTVLSESVKLDCKNTSNLFLLSILLLFCKGENSKTEEILPQEDFIKFHKNLNSRDKDHNSVQKQIIEEFVSLKNNFVNRRL
jgi:hypothetical protein